MIHWALQGMYSRQFTVKSLITDVPNPQTYMLLFRIVVVSAQSIESMC